MPQDQINLHIPPERANSVIIDLLTQNLAMSQALTYYIVGKLEEISNPSAIEEELSQIINDSLAYYFTKYEEYQKEIIAKIMSKYSE